jgi:hypothetical protein
MKTTTILATLCTTASSILLVAAPAFGQEDGAPTDESLPEVSTEPVSQEPSKTTEDASEAAADAGAEAGAEAQPAKVQAEEDGSKADSQQKPAEEKTDVSDHKQKKPLELKKQADYQKETPDWLKNKLRLSSAASFGAGSGSSDDFSSDYLGFSVGALYAVQKLTSGDMGIRLVSGGKYATHTGVLTEANKDASVQRFLALAGAEVRLKQSDYRFGALVGLGLAKATSSGFKTSNRFTSTYGFTFSVEVYGLYQVYKKVALQTALEAAPLSNGWYGLSVGPSLTF